MLQVQLFGSGAACYFDRSMDGFPSQQSYQVFCYLLINREYKQNRERLASVFWGNYATEASRKYLRNSLWKLRQMFQSVGARMEDYVLVDDDHVEFQKASPYQLDVETFETLISGSRSVPGENLSAEQSVQLAQAVRLYRGDLLEGVEEEWCLYERERLNLLYLSALTKLMVYHRVQHNFTSGLEYGEKVLAFDNTRENVHREMMLLHWLNGMPPLALSQYNRCAQILHDHFGIAPTEETSSLYEQMLHHRFAPARDALVTRTELDPSFSRDSATALALEKIQHLRNAIDEINQELSSLDDLIRQLRKSCS